MVAVSPAVAHLRFQTLWALVVALRWVVRAFAALPSATLAVPTPPPAALANAVAARVLRPWTTRPARRIAIVGLLAAAAGLATAIGTVPDGQLHVTSLDVGQGDAILVRGPDGRALLVDTGGGGWAGWTGQSWWCSRSSDGLG